MLRASPPHCHMEGLDMFEDALVSFLPAITNVRFEEKSLVQVASPYPVVYQYQKAIIFCLRRENGDLILALSIKDAGKQRSRSASQAK